MTVASQLWPAGYAGELLPIEIPEGKFYLRYPWADRLDGPYDGATFITEPETNIAYSSNYPAHPVYLRCARRESDWMVMLDGDGTEWRCQLIPV